MPKPKSRRAKQPRGAKPAVVPGGGPSVRSFWSGTITFGLVSIPVDLFSAVRPRQTAMKLVDKSGHALGRQYHCSKEGTKLDGDDLVRGYETDGKMVEITDDDFASVAPEMSSDIELRNFVPLEQIPSLYFQKPYFLAPAGKSAKAYHLLAATMESTGRVGIGSFVMRGHEYLVAIVSDNGVMRADTLRYADEVRTPESIGLPKRSKGAAKMADQFVKDIEALTRTELDISELQDNEAQALQELVKEKQKNKANVIEESGLEEADPESGDGAKIIDLMAVLRKSLSKGAVVTNARGGAPVDLAERRAQKKATSTRKAPKKKAARSPATKRARSG
ncbi:MAG: Ku protein [Steroidobacteraceae bacterium]